MTFIKGVSGLNEEKVPVALYDMDIEDVNERREKRLVFESIVKAANFLGHRPQAIGERIKDKHYVYHRTSQKKYAIRKLTVSSNLK